MRIKILLLALAIIGASTTAWACAYPDRGPTPADPMVAVWTAYEQILKKYGVGAGQAGKIAGKQGEADVRFAVTYEAYRDVDERARQLGETLRRLQNSASGQQRALVEARGKLRDAAVAPQDREAPRLDADDLAALADMARRLEAMERKLLDKAKPLQDRWQALTREAAELKKRLLDTLATTCPAEVPTAQVGGSWSGLNMTYALSQSGNTVTWRNEALKEDARGTIKGNKIEMSWNGNWGPGSATGDVVIENGRAVRINWSNGVVFLRK